MADRTTRVVLSAVVSNYVAGMEQAARKTRDVGTAAEKLAAQRQGFDVLGRSMLAFGAVAAAGVAIAVTRFAQFDKAMSSVKASTQESAANMDLLRAAALEAGASTVYTATEAAGAIESLAKAGISTADILGGGLSGALDLAAAGELGVADAADIAATAMTQFNLQGTEVPHIADLLAAGAGKAQGSVQDMAAALNQSGLVASQMGLSLEETSGTLTAFASAGLLGSDAGTSFRTMLLRLANPTEEAKDLMKELGINAYDASGNFVGMESIAGQLQTRMGGLDQSTRDAAMATLFGSDAIRAANVLYSEGAPGIAKWTAEVDSSGYAAKVAFDRLDNLSGDLEKLGGAIDTALIQTGSAANDALRGLTQTLTFLVDSIGNLPPDVLGVGLALGGVVSAIALVGGGALVAIPRIADFKDALESLNISGKSAAIGIGAATVALSAITVLVGTQVSVMAESAGRVDEFADSLDQATGSVTDYTRELAVARLEQSGAYDAAERMGIGFDLVTEAAMGNAAAVAELKDRSNEWLDENGRGLGGLLNGNAFAFDTLRQSVGGVTRELEGGQEQWDTTRQAMADVAGEQRAAEEAAYAQADALAELKGAASGADEEIDALSDTIRGFGDFTISAEKASMAFEEAVDNAKEAVKENGATLDINTEKGRANRKALLDIAEAAKENAAATLERTGSEEKARAKVEQGREALIKAMMQMGKSREAAEKYADKLGLIPKNITTAANVTGIPAAEAKLQHLIRPRQTYIQAIVTGASGVGSNRVAANGGLWSYANGGIQSYASGGYPNGIYQGGTPLYKFAEPETGWEAFISGKPGMERKNIGHALEALSRLAPKVPGLFPTGGGYGGGGPRIAFTQHITQYNPINEPGSEGVRRAGQIAAATLGSM